VFPYNGARGAGAGGRNNQNRMAVSFQYLRRSAQERHSAAPEFSGPWIV
jgi:hypothetical protein